MTHTIAELEISELAYNEIARRLKAVEIYDHIFLDDGVIDMSGIGLKQEHPDNIKDGHDTSSSKAHGNIC